MPPAALSKISLYRMMLSLACIWMPGRGKLTPFLAPFAILLYSTRVRRAIQERMSGVA